MKLCFLHIFSIKKTLEIKQNNKFLESVAKLLQLLLQHQILNVDLKYPLIIFYKKNIYLSNVFQTLSKFCWLNLLWLYLLWNHLTSNLFNG